MLEIERKDFGNETNRKGEGIESEETMRRCSQGKGKRKQTKRVERIRGTRKRKAKKERERQRRRREWID